jgi:hypothetical protein
MSDEKLKRDYDGLLKNFVYYTEVALASFESADMRKGTSKSDKQRFHKIAVDMLFICRDRGVQYLKDVTCVDSRCGRVQEMMDNEKFKEFVMRKF